MNGRSACLVALRAIAVSGSCVLGSMSCPAEVAKLDTSIRLLPYPFSQVISFASDADALRPWHGAAIHRIFNEELGLTISDSLWPQGGKGASSLFLGPGQLNRTPSGIGTEPAFALLLRQWHRGNIDHFHSWHEDSPIALRNEIEPPSVLSSGRTSRTLPPVPLALSVQASRNVRFYFTAPPPEDLSIVLYDARGMSAAFGPAKLVRGKSIQLEVGALGSIVELIVPPSQSGDASPVFNPMAIDRIDLVAPSCKTGCATSLIRIERDHFSRSTVLSEIPWLEAWNLRPAFLSSHGGNTLSQNFGVPGKTLEFAAYDDPAVYKIHEALADRKESHAYHSDLLRRLGVLAVWSYFPAEGTHLFLSPAGPEVLHSLPPLSSTYERFYNLPRAELPLFDISDDARFNQSAKLLLPALSDEERKELYCGPGCNLAQGNALAMLVAQHLDLVNNAKKVKSLVYTHFGSENGTNVFSASPEQPVTPAVLKWMRRLANHVYNFDGAVGADRRVWSPPANTWLRYQVMHSGIASHLRITPDGSTITIVPWKDPVTQTIWPDMRAGTRDLHGLTLYVSDIERASVKIADREVDAFTRNPPDETGRRSITLVDDHAPTTIIGRVALKDRGDMNVISGNFADISDGASHISLEADDSGHAGVVIKPWSLDLWNTSHLRFAVRKRCGGENVKGCLESRFRIELRMQDGGSVSVLEERRQHVDTKSSTWSVPRLHKLDEWMSRTLDVAQLAWPAYAEESEWRRPPLPIGRVKEVRISLADATKGTILDVRNFAALRPSGNGQAPDGTKLVAGRVTLDGSVPVPRAKVDATSLAGNVAATTTDEDGYYFLSGQSKGEVLEIRAQIGQLRCFPMQGRRIEVNKDEAEIDIEMNNCVHQALPIADGH
jgi:hypothetical protein